MAFDLEQEQRMSRMGNPAQGVGRNPYGGGSAGGGGRFAGRGVTAPGAVPGRGSFGGASGIANPYAQQSSSVGVAQSPEQLGVAASDLTKLNLQPMSMDPYRQSALQDIEAGSASGLAGARTQLAQTGGLGAADRMALASQFNRDKIMGRQKALGKYAGMEAQSAADADRANQMFNAQMFNENLYRNLATSERAEDRQRADEMLERQLEASGMMADAQMRAANKSPGGLLGGQIIPGIL